MSLPSFSLQNRHTVWALAIAAAIFGGLAYLRLPIQLFPETAPPLVNVLTPYPGAAAQDVADLVSEPIEAQCASLQGVYEVSSTSQDGLSLVTVEFDYDRSVDLAAVDVQNAIARIRARLPPAIGEPQVLEFSTSDRPVLTVGLVGDDLVALRRLAEEVAAPALQRLPGVAMVDVFGGHRPEVAVEVDRDRLEAHGLPLAAVAEALRAHNVSLPAGQIRARQRQYTFRVDQQSRTLAELARIPVAVPGGARVVVGDVAAVTYGSGEDQSRFRADGQPAIGVQVFRQDEANTVAVVGRVRAGLAQLEARFSQMRVVEAEESASFTQAVVDNMLGSVWQALLLASVVIVLFLGSLRRGLVVILSMPMSFAITFAAMRLLGMSLDLVTLTAIILAVGMVVDSSVVMLENISRRREEEGLGPGEAAMAGAAEVQFAVVAGIATTLVVLVPLLFLYGFVGKVFMPLALTLILAFGASLVVALSLVPVLAAHLAAGGGRVERLAAWVSRPWNRTMDGLRRQYVSLLRWALTMRWVVFAVALALLAGSLALLRGQGMELLPKIDNGSTLVTVETPSGASLDETEAVIRQVEAAAMADPAVVHVATQIGFEPGMHSLGAAGAQGPTAGSISLTLTPRTGRDRTIWEIQDSLRSRLARIPGIQNWVVREVGGTARATTAASIAVSLRGEDPLVLDHLGDLALERLRRVPGVTNPYRSWRRDQRTEVVTLDPERSRELGLAPAAAARQLAQALDGIAAGTYRAGGDDTPIRVRYAPAFRSSAAGALAVRSSWGEGDGTVPIGAVAAAREVLGQGLVSRENLEPTLRLLALHQGRPLSAVAADVRRAMSDLPLPRGYTVAMEGEDKDMGESRREILRALAAAVVAIYLLLVAQFRSFVHPVTVLASVPLSLIGVAAALYLTGKPVSMPVMIGLILLVGIVVNNAIILIDFIRRRREAGMDRREAIVASVATRFRPILMTSLSTIVGMLPLALESALGAERFSPLAIAVIGGMTSSTFLTLVAIPVIYDALDDLVGGAPA